MPETPALLPETEAQLSALGSVEYAVGVAASDRLDDARGALDTAKAGLRRRFPGVRSVVLYAHPGTAAVEAVVADGEVTVLDLPWRSAGADRGSWPRTPAAELVFLASQRLRARACAVLGVEVATQTPEWIGRLLAPVVDQDQDLVAAYYMRHPFAGAVTTGILYPLIRALYGRRLRYPLGAAFGCSARMVERQMHREAVRNGAGRQSIELRLLTDAVAGGMRVCQAMLGPRTVAAGEGGAGLSAILTDVLSLVFSEMGRSTGLWQKIRGSTPVPLVGTADESSIEPVAVDPKRLLEAFRVGQKNLPEVWGMVLPPSTLVELKKMARLPDAEVRLPDRLWSRIVYDFAIAYHTRVMSRDHLMGALAPLYLGWFGAWYMELGETDPLALEDRLEQLCLQFEAEKPYLISRWRWPDRFNP
jgi:hypothetical protein